MDPNQNLGENPAATIANAAMNGATPVVTTTDLNASDVAPEPTLQAPVLDTSALGAPVLDASVLDTAALEAAATAENPAAPVENGPVSLTPSADFQMGEVSTVSAVQNGADGNLAAQNEEIMIGQPLETPAASQSMNQSMDQPMDQAMDQALMDTEANAPSDNTGAEPESFSNSEEPSDEGKISIKDLKQEFKDDPVIAAAPVPGSIGSAKSYADIQRAEAEKAARMAAKGAKGAANKKNIIMIAAIAAVVVVGIVVGAIIMLNGNSKPTPAVAPVTEYPDPIDDADLSTLSCKRSLVPEEYVSYGALSGTQENIFYFKDDLINGLATNFSYAYQDQATTDFWRDKLAADYGVTPNAEEDEEENEEEAEEPGLDEGETEATVSGKKTTAEMLHHYVTTNGFIVTHGMEILSEDINDWIASDAYSDVTYGAVENGAAAPAEEGEEGEEVETETEDGEVIRNLQYYKRLQNSIGYKCEIYKGY